MADFRDELAGVGFSELVQRLLDRDYNRVVESVLQAVGTVTARGLIARRLREVEAEALRLAAEGEKLEPDNPILRALIADLGDSMRAAERLVDGAAEDVQATGTNAAGTIQRQMALGGTTDVQLARIGIRWNVPDPEAVARLVGYAESDAWQAGLRRDFGEGVVQTVQNQAIRGIVGGWHPTRTAREITRISEQLPIHVANNLMRTLQLTSYRDGTAIHQTANIDIIEAVIRVAALDDRTCLTCIALHGEVLWEGVQGELRSIPRVDDHHSGRCTSIVKIIGREVNIGQTGPQWFNGLPDERKMTIAGPAAFNALQAGAVELRDFVKPYTDPTFGPMLREASLLDVLGDGAKQYYS